MVGKSEMEVVLKWCKRAGITDSVPCLIRQVGKRLKRSELVPRCQPWSADRGEIVYFRDMEKDQKG